MPGPQEDAMTDAPEPPEVVEVEDSRVACDGDTHDHPRVFLAIGAEGWVECPYCDRRFVLKEGTGTRAGH